MMQTPNIIYIHSHDTGRFIEPYGHAIPTPNLLQLAQNGAIFRQAFCAAPTCSPSRAALLSGRNPHSVGMLGLAHRGFALHEGTQLLSHLLAEHEYTTVLCGVQHVMNADELETSGYQIRNLDRNITHEFAAEFLQSKPQQPFFLDVGFFETHRNGRGFGAGDGVLDDRAVRVPPGLPDTPQTRRDMADYIASAQILDEKIGRVLRALEASGVAENTFIFYTTDHGIAFPGMKCNLTDGGIGVSLIASVPPEFRGGKVVGAMVSHMDIFPTVCELAGIPAPEHLEGKSLLPLVRGEVEALHDELFSEVTYHAAYEPQRAVRTSRWKYIRRYGKRTRRAIPNCDPGLSKDLFLAGGWHEKELPREELYDLLLDPCEGNNLAARPEYSSTLEAMRNRLDDWMQRTDDPLCAGDVPEPPGATISDADSFSPGDKPPK